MDKQIQDFQRLAVPGQRVVQFSQPGGYVIYVERPGSCCAFSISSGGSGDVGSGPRFSSWSMNIALQTAADGQLVPIRTWRGATESYAAAGHQGQTAMYFTIDRPGAYHLGARKVEPSSLTDIAVGRGIGQSVFIAVLLPLIGIFVLAPAGLLVGIITAVRRRRARRTLLAARSVPQPAPMAPPVATGWQPAPAQSPGGQVGGGAWQGQGGGTPGSAPPPQTPLTPTDPDQESAGEAPNPQSMQ